MRRMAALVAILAAITAGTMVGGGGCPGAVNMPDGADPWGGCFPGASNTGVPSGTSLTTFAAISGTTLNPTTGDVTITGNNVTIDSKDVSGCIYIEGYGAMIKNSQMKCVWPEFGSASVNTANPRFTVQDSTIDCEGDPAVSGTSVGIRGRNFNAYRNEIINCENGFSTDGFATIKDNWAHNPWTGGESHPDGLEAGADDVVIDQLVIEHNDLRSHTDTCTYPTETCNGQSSINVNNNFANPSPLYVMIKHNRISGGTYSLNCSRPSTTDFHVIDNAWVTDYSVNSGFFGPASDCENDEEWSGNTWITGPNAGTAVVP